MNPHVLGLKRRFVEELGRAALEYLDAGLDLFHRHLRSEAASSRAAFGNLSEALELTLASVLAEKNLAAVFLDIPPQARGLLSAPERVPEFFRWRASPVDLGAASFRAVDLATCVAGYYVFFPHMKQPLLPHLEFIAKRAARGRFTAARPPASYELERTGYAVLMVVKSLENDPAFSGYIGYAPGDRDRRFLDEFAAKRIERVSLALEQAGVSPPEYSAGRRAMPQPPGIWEYLLISCPVCGKAGALGGYSELAMSRGEEGPEPGLDFFAVSYSCRMCGLTLYDHEELKLAGLATLYDRSAEIDSWFDTHGGSEYWGEE